MKKVTKIFMIIVAVAISTVYTADAQISINTDGTDPDASAMLDVKSTDKGMLIPRMTQTQMDSITNPATGLSVYNTDMDAVCYFNGTDWDCMDAQSLFNKTFVCGQNLKDFRDKQSYSTVQIGTQCWMAENLNIGTMVNGSVSQTDNSTIEKYCSADLTSNCDTYGGLYQWNEMMQYDSTEGIQGICPSGWHLPTDAEYKTLEMYLGMTSSDANNTGSRGTNEGSKLAGNASLWTNGNLDSNTDFGTSGFTGLPGGDRSTNGSFGYLAHVTYFWSSSENGSDGWFRHLSYNSARVDRNYIDQAYGFSVRCVRN